MEQLMNRNKPRDLLRWSLYAAFLASTIAIAPEYWTADRLPRELLYVCALTTFVPMVLLVMIVRARHESPLRQFPLWVALLSFSLFEATIKIGLTGTVVVMLVLWVMVVCVEWRRLREEERRSA